MAMTLFLAILNHSPVSVYPKLWRKSMQLCTTWILARLWSLWTAITTGVFRLSEINSDLYWFRCDDGLQDGVQMVNQSNYLLCVFQLWWGEKDHGQGIPQTYWWDLQWHDHQSDGSFPVQKWVAFEADLNFPSHDYWNEIMFISESFLPLLTLILSSSGFTYIYSGPQMYEFSLRSGRLFRVLGNDYFLPCTNF